MLPLQVSECFVSMDLSFMKPRWVCVAAAAAQENKDVFVCCASRWDQGLELKLTETCLKSVSSPGAPFQNNFRKPSGTVQLFWEAPRGC